MALPMYNNNRREDNRINPRRPLPIKPGRPMPIFGRPKPPRRPITPMPNPKLPQPPRRPITPMPNPKLPQPVGKAPTPPVDSKSPFSSIEDAAKWAALNGWVKSPSPVGGNATPPAPVKTNPADRINDPTLEAERRREERDKMIAEEKARQDARRQEYNPEYKYQGRVS